MQPKNVFDEGAVVGGGYRVVGRIAEGGMGSVFEVEQLTTGARRALKVMHVQLASDPKLRDRFVREARVGATIPSDHVADVVDAGVDERTGLPFLVMELLEGVTLSREIRRRGPFDWPMAREVFRQLGHAVAAAHSCGIVHRDLKPANVFLARSRTAGMPFVLKVLDFGISEIVASVQLGTSGVIGTPTWMAPEQADPHAPIGPTADVWALGLIAFALFTGRQYWPMANIEAAPTAAMLYRLTSEEIVTASMRAASYDASDRLPTGFDAWFARCVDRDPARRFADGAEAHAAFSVMMSETLGADTLRGTLPPLAAFSVDDAPAATFEEVSTHAPTRVVNAVSRRARMRRWLMAGAALAAGGAALGAFSFVKARVSAASVPAAALAQPPSVPPPAPVQILARVHGSNTIGAELAPALAQAFLTKETGVAAPILRHVAPDEMQVEGRTADGVVDAIEIEAHGSSTAFKDLASGACDVGMASRRIHPEEVTALASLGAMASAASEHVIALDGIAVVVNPANPVTRLSLAQLARVFSGDAPRWSAVGGPDEPIVVHARDDKSGTYDTFKALVLGTRPLEPGVQRYESNEALADAVAGDVNAVGFVGLAYVRSAKAVMIQDAASAPLLPSSATVATEDYALSRRLYLYAPPTAPEAARRFVDFALSDEGQAVVAHAGFVDLRPECDPNARACPACGAEIRATVAGACRLSIDFRFDSASKQLDTRALRDLQRLGPLLARGQYAGKRLVLLGFSDGEGKKSDNDALSLGRANVVADQLRARGLAVDVVRGFGSDMPVADDTTEPGRQRNRRVEAWIR